MSGPVYVPMRHVEPITSVPLGFPRPFCPVCAEKWMKQLWVGCCVCTGDVKLGSPAPSAPPEPSRPVIEVAATIVPPEPKRRAPRKASSKPKKAADEGGLF